MATVNDFMKGQEDVRKEKEVRKAAIYAKTSWMLAEDEDVMASRIADAYSIIEKNPDMELSGVYTDEQCDGIALMRPEFMKMLDDILAGDIDVIVVSNLGTISSNLIELCYLLLEIFPEMGVKVEFDYASLDCDKDDDISCLIDAMGRYSSYRADMNR